MNKDNNPLSLYKIANELRLDVVKMLGTTKIGHIGGSFSIAEIISVLYFYKMKIDPVSFPTENHDRFILSKGHTALILYAALAKKGFFGYEELGKIKNIGAMLQQHPVKSKTPGIEVSTGSLGMGLSMAIGIALAMRHKRNFENKVYVLIGDGEAQEGQVWEAMACAKKYKLDNLVMILDNNGLQATGFVEDVSGVPRFSDKIRCFGWNVIEIDGNNVNEIIEALNKADKVDGKPTAIIANTIKGKGCSFTENNPNFHYGSLSQTQYDTALSELGGKY